MSLIDLKAEHERSIKIYEAHKRENPNEDAMPTAMFLAEKDGTVAGVLVGLAADMRVGEMIAGIAPKIREEHGPIRVVTVVTEAFTKAFPIGTPETNVPHGALQEEFAEGSHAVEEVVNVLTVGHDGDEFWYMAKLIHDGDNIEFEPIDMEATRHEGAVRNACLYAVGRA